MVSTCGEPAAGVLLAVMRDDLAPHSTRVSAARTVLEQTHRAAELDDVEERVAALEAWVAAPTPERRGNGGAH